MIVYETAKDRANEAAVVARIERALRVKAASYSRMSRMDIDLYRDGHVLAVAEIKTRKNPATAYPDYLIDLDKLTALRARADALAAVPVLFVRWTGDDLRMVNVRRVLDAGVRTTITKRRDRPVAPNLVALIPMDAFRPVPR